LRGCQLFGRSIKRNGYGFDPSLFLQLPPHALVEAVCPKDPSCGTGSRPALRALWIAPREIPEWAEYSRSLMPFTALFHPIKAMILLVIKLITLRARAILIVLD
jgi:hypothetical protein